MTARGLSGAHIHIAFVTDDIELATARISRLLGIDDARIKHSPPPEVAKARLRGVPTRARCRQVNVRWGTVGIEIIEPDGAPSTWQEFLDTHGPGVHHIGLVDDDQHASVVLGHEGAATLQTGSFPGGSYAYYDTTDALGVLVEVLTLDTLPS